MQVEKERGGWGGEKSSLHLLSKFHQVCAEAKAPSGPQTQ